MSDLYDLDLFDANPYQTRREIDPEHVKALAESIEQQGLLQIPVGRLKMEWGTGTRVQLAFGHSRLEAFKLLRDSGKANKIKFNKMPVALQELSDEQMFQLAVTENAQRRDLSPIETARAMKRYRDEFGKTSAEIGALWGVSDVTVRGKIRLLQLPEDVLAAMETNPTSERVTRELIKLFDIPEEARKIAEHTSQAWNEMYRPSAIVRRALQGETAEQIAGLIKSMINSIGTPMADSQFKHDQEFEGGDFRSPTCKKCPLRLVSSDYGPICLDKKCYEAKQTEVRRQYLAEASAACGIQPIENAATKSYEVTNWWEEGKAKRIAATGCENLRLVWDNHSHSDVEGFPNAQICCKKTHANCVCNRVLNSGQVTAVQAEPQPAGKSLAEVFASDLINETDEDNAAPAPSPAVPSAEQLREINRNMRANQRQNLEECRAMREDFSQRIYQALLDRNVEIWKWAVQSILPYNNRESLQNLPVDELWLVLAQHLAKDRYDWTYTKPNSAEALKSFNAKLSAAGLELMESVAAETD